MIHREFLIEEGGRRSVRLVFPCFEWDAHPEAACRMNRFYAACADAAYRYAQTLPEGRRFGYFCSCEVSEEQDVTEVRLRFSLRRNGEVTLRRTLLHRWKDGALLPHGKE